MGIFRASWERDFLILFYLSFVFSIIVYSVHLSNDMLKWLPWALGVPIVFLCIIILYSYFISKAIKKGMFDFFWNLNNYSYFEAKSQRKFGHLIVALCIYLVIFYIYFDVLGLYQNISGSLLYHLQILLLGWMVLVFVRTTHYANYKIGENVGHIIISFFFPFGMVIGMVLFHQFTLDNSLNQMFEYVVQKWQILPFFMILLSVSLILELFMDFRNRNIDFSESKQETVVETETPKEKNIIEYRETLYSIDYGPKKKEFSNTRYERSWKRSHWEGIDIIEKNINSLHKDKKESVIDKKVDKLILKK